MKKERQRYILFKIFRENNGMFDQKILLKVIWQSIWRYFGLKEANKIGLWLVEFDLKNNYGIIRCSHQTKEVIISALTLITEISGETIKSLNKVKEMAFKKKN